MDSVTNGVGDQELVFPGREGGCSIACGGIRGTFENRRVHVLDREAWWSRFRTQGELV